MARFLCRAAFLKQLMAFLQSHLWFLCYALQLYVPSSCGGRNLPFSIDLSHGLYNSLYYSPSCCVRYIVQSVMYCPRPLSLRLSVRLTAVVLKRTWLNCNFNCRIETEVLPKVIGSHVSFLTLQQVISGTVQDGEVVTTECRSDMWPIESWLFR